MAGRRIKIQHNKLLLNFIIVLIILFIVFVIYAFNQNKIDDNNGYIFDNDKGDEVECNIDSDCVPDICCHASNCVPIGEAPDCSDMFCTTVCIDGTLDCGQGNCLCVNGKCNAVFE